MGGAARGVKRAGCHRMTVVGIIVAYGAISLLTQATRSALEAGVDQIVIWDNSSENSAAEIRNQFPGDSVRVEWSGENLGFGAGVNRAVRNSNAVDGDQLLLLNPDALIEAECLTRMQEVLAMSPGVVAPRMRYPNGEFGISGGPRPSLTKEILARWRMDELVPHRMKKAVMRLFSSAGSASYGASLEKGGPVRVDWVSGFCMMLDYEAFRAVHGFDERYFLYFEDVDICLRLRSLGYEATLVRDVAADHWESTTTSSTGKASHYAAGRSQFFRIHGSDIERFAQRLVRL